MILDRILFLAPLFISFLASAGVSLYCWQRRTLPGALAFSFVALNQAIWTAGYTLELIHPRLEEKLFWDNFQFINIAVWPYAFLVFTLQYTGRSAYRRWPNHFLLAAPLVCLPILGFTDSAHHLLRGRTWLVQSGPFNYLLYDFNWLLYGIFVFTLLVYLAGVGRLLMQFYRSNFLQSAQVIFVIAGGGIPVLGALFTVTVLRDWHFRDLSPLTGAISSLVIALALFRPPYFGILPTVRSKIFEIMHDGVIVVDMQGNVIEINTSAHQLLGCKGSKSKRLTFAELFGGWPDVLIRLNPLDLQEMTQEEIELVLGGEEKVIHLTIQPLYDDYQHRLGVLIVLRDVTKRRSVENALKDELIQRKKVEEKLRLLNEGLERRVEERTAELMRLNQELRQELRHRQEAERALRNSEERYALATQGANDGLWDWDLRTNLVFYSQRWKAMFGYADHEIGSGIEEWLNRIHPDDMQRVRREIMAHLDGLSKDFHSEHRIAHKDGQYVWVLCRGLAVREPDGPAYRMAGSCSDITSRKLAEEQLLYNALHDSLTGLPNRVLFLDRLGRSVERARRHTGYHYAILYLDFDHFKAVNDSLGHAMGDRLLVSATGRLLSCVRSADTLARLGGDEFVILAEDIADLEQAYQIARRIGQELALPYPLNEHEVVCTASIGIVLGGAEYERPEDVLRDADIAMYQAKLEGRARYKLFSAEMRQQVVRRLEMEIELPRALERGEFVLHYQPVVELSSLRVIGFEALVRWKHPEKGLIPPNKFIPLAEETGLIGLLGKWIMFEACRQLKRWNTCYAAHPPLKMAINMSPRQFTQAGFDEQVHQIFQETGVNPEDVYLEITENVLINNPEIRNSLFKLRRLGVKIQLDDFGTGYSSLSYLHQLPIDAIKIDRSFIQQIGTAALSQDGKTGPEIVRTIISLAQTLGMQVIGEGVETRLQMYQLKELGCQFSQGFLFYKPLDAEKVETLLSNANLKNHISPHISPSSSVPTV